MKQRLNDCLAVSFICAANVVEVGDVVRLSADNTVAAINAAGALDLVGTVCQYTKDELVCTVETRFRERRDDRIADASAGCAIGPFVWNAAGEALAYSAVSHDPAAIAGLVINAGTAGAVCETLEY